MPGHACYAFDTLGALYAALHRVYALGVSLPYAPLREFELQVQGLPRTTDAERLVVQRIGQNIFRTRLLDYWQNRCPLTGIADPHLLRASHIIPWSECESDAQRLDVHNGLLLSALWDAAFDNGLCQGLGGSAVPFHRHPLVTIHGSPPFSLQLGGPVRRLRREFRPLLYRLQLVPRDDVLHLLTSLRQVMPPQLGQTNRTPVTHERLVVEQRDALREG